MENYLKDPRCEISNNRAPRGYIQFLFENLPDMEIQTHPERLKQMLPWGKLIQESFAQQDQAPDSAPGASCLSVNLLSPGGYVFSVFQLHTDLETEHHPQSVLLAVQPV